MKGILILAALLTSGWSSLIPENLNPLSDEYIEAINNLGTTWKAGRNFPKDTSKEYIRNLCGLIKDNGNHLPTRYHDTEGVEIPESYDVREAWSQCKSVHVIRDQGDCGACWAHAGVEAMSDRICIASKGKIQVEVSAQDVISCDKNAGGCQGGHVEAAWEYWRDTGIVSGGLYQGEGCKPYGYPPCSHMVPGPYPPCGGMAKTPECEIECVPGYNKSYTEDKTYGKNVYSLPPDEEQLQIEIMKHGPIEVGIAIYEDMLHYKSGVYQHHSGIRWSTHAIKMLGWGVENGVKYWLLANSWNPYWGDNGKSTHT
ncbi:CTSB [Cordylochernes scorpioides]|uniref:CTSB n=1 Tax=Cordylochernes scorpioides TaxID=51811 RepID=A0ABY6K650_9ARAC|nr:CTSB [Cordylochernes scorpioides]